ncbi:sodium:calcium antiporter [Thermobifida halotolerans]|uniref:Sodium:calcium antiporter n=1 Tax=Thermobifida halotolerans TaxID=483545 RepID=A0A399FU82_9ACTN|nr:cation transporter [Thermobifida halotolerans]UOE19038.1 sodium:calcium antiporter [Thermobifida halotolerans]
MDGWPLPLSVAVLLSAVVVLVVSGGPFTRLADRLADRTGIGETMAGIVLIGSVTSLPGLITSILGAVEGDAAFAMNNALGGIALQTTFIALADLAYRSGNLEHAAASLPNLLAPISLSIMLATVLVAGSGPQFTVAGTHPVSLLLVFLYWYWLRLSRTVREKPLWKVTQTHLTRPDVPGPESERPGESLRRMWLVFALLAAMVSVTGYAVGQAGLVVAEQTGLSGGVVGALVTGTITSLPELVTVLYAVRIRALHLAIGDIIGGNGFDMLFLTVSDIVYREGTIYSAMGPEVVLVVGVGIILNLLVAAGLIRRQSRGIGFEGIAILVVYLVGVAMLIRT